MITLPTEKHRPETGWPKQASYLIAGAPKVGKTLFAEQWPKCLILNLEKGGCKYVSKAAVQDINSWEELQEVYGILRKQGDKMPYETIAIDTIDVVNDWSEQITRKELGIVQMGEAGYGADWGNSRERVLTVIKQFQQLPVNLLIISHSRWAIVNDVKIGHTIDLPGKLSRFAMARIDNILFIITEKGKRKLIFQPTEGVEAGSRNPILNKAGSCECSYKALRSLFKDKEEENANGE